MNIQKQVFGKTPDGTKVHLYTLTSKNGLSAKIMDYGAILVSLEVPDRNGNAVEITLGYDSIEGYYKNSSYFGSPVGRIANRISRARFILNNTEYKLAANHGEHHLHGGIMGFNKVSWTSQEFEDAEEAGVRLTYLSIDGEEGYPGNLNVEIRYSLTDDGQLKMAFEGRTDKTTVINLTHHAYYNLAGDCSGDVLNHNLQINADKCLVVDDKLIPTGELMSVKGTPLDFTKMKRIGSEIEQTASGYDDCYIINKDEEELTFAAKVYESESGRVMEVYTTEPSIQLYTAGHLDGSEKCRNGCQYRKYAGLCLETQHYPDSPNRPEFPSVVLNPGEKYNYIVVHKFYTK